MTRRITRSAIAAVAAVAMSSGAAVTMLAAPAYALEHVDAWRDRPRGAQPPPPLVQYFVATPDAATPAHRTSPPAGADTGGRSAATSEDAPGRSGGRVIANGPEGLYVTYPNGEGWRRDPAGRWTLLLRPVAPEPSATAPVDSPPAPVRTELEADTRLAAALRNVSGVHTVTPLHGGGYMVTAAEGTKASALRLPGVEHVSDAPVAKVAGVTFPPDARDVWFLKNSGPTSLQANAVAGADVNAVAAWERTRGSGAVVAVIDTGFAPPEDLATALWTDDHESCAPGTDLDQDGRAADCHGWNFLSANGDLANGTGGWHGTMVAASAAARAGNVPMGAGLAPAAKVMPLVVGSDRSVSVALAIEAVYYAVDHGAKVINCSFGGPANEPWLDRWNAALAYAAAKDVLVVAAAGNDSNDRDTAPSYPASLTAPNLVTVAATTNADTLAGFSAYGVKSVDLAAPGENLVLPWYDGRQISASGTSFAAPVVAAAGALLYALDPTRDVTKVKDELVWTGRELPSLRGKIRSARRLDAGAVVDSVARPASYTVSGLDAFRTGARSTATIRVLVDKAPLPAGPLRLKVALGVRTEVGVSAIAGLAVDGRAAGTATTDDDGVVTLAPPGLDAAALVQGADVPIDVTLPDGEFVLAMQLAKPDGAVVGRPDAVFFTVGTGGAAPGGGPVGDRTILPAVRPTGIPVVPTSTPTAGPAPAPAPSAPAVPPAPPVAPAYPPVPPRQPGTVPVAPPTSVPTTPHTSVPTTRPTSVPTTRPTSGPATPPASGPTTAPAPTRDPVVVPSRGPVSPPAPGPVVVPTAAPVAPPAAPPTTPTFPASPGFGITKVSPASGPSTGGTTVLLSGSRLPAYASVVVDGLPARVLYWSATAVIIVMPAHVPGKADITVFAPDGTSETLRDVYTYLPSAGGSPAPSTAPVAPPAVPPTAGPQPPGGSTPPGPTAPPTTPAESGAPSPPQAFAPGVRLVPVRPGSMLAGVSHLDWSLAGCAASSCDAIGV